MVTRSRSVHRRYACLTIVAVVAAAMLSARCSGEGSAERVAAEAAMGVETSQSFVTFTNRSGLPMSDITISIIPYGPGEFTRLLPRIENTVKRQIPLTEFRGRDGTPFNLRVMRPKAVRVRAQDGSGKSYDAEFPWK